MMKSILFAGIVSLGALTASGAAQADSFGFGVGGQNGGFYFYSGDGHHGGKKHHYQKRKRGKTYYQYGQGPQYWHGHRGKLTPFQVRQDLRHRGFRQIHFFDRHGKIYRANALNRRGRPVGLAINAWTGQIVNRWPLYRY